MTSASAQRHYSDTDPLEHVELLIEVVRAMVEIPEAVRVEEKHTGTNEVTLWIDVAPKDRGKVIGKVGRNITSLRTLFSSIGALDGKRILVMVAEPGKTFTHPPRVRKASPEVSRIRRKSGFNTEEPEKCGNGGND